MHAACGQSTASRKGIAQVQQLASEEFAVFTVQHAGHNDQLNESVRHNRSPTHISQAMQWRLRQQAGTGHEVHPDGHSR